MTALRRPAMVDATLRTYRRTFTWNGRDTRRDFFSFLFLFLLALALVFTLDGALLRFAQLTGVPQGLDLEAARAVRDPAAALFFFANLPTLLASAVRRLHDAGNGGWLLLAVFVPYVGWAIVLGGLLNAGMQEPNIYGENPRAEPPGRLADPALFE